MCGRLIACSLLVLTAFVTIACSKRESKPLMPGLSGSAEQTLLVLPGAQRAQLASQAAALGLAVSGETVLIIEGPADQLARLEARGELPVALDGT
ncbi:MAG TPA: hypothetical protein VFV50_01790 [Bdellovibrionales bacterium]|nr:hypothetical protein [Bdellovibrionales bacterium]